MTAASVRLMEKQAVLARVVLSEGIARLTRTAVMPQAAFPSIWMRRSARIAPPLPSQLWILSAAKVAVLSEGSCGA